MIVTYSSWSRVDKMQNMSSLPFNQTETKYIYFMGLFPELALPTSKLRCQKNLWPFFANRAQLPKGTSFIHLRMMIS